MSPELSSDEEKYNTESPLCDDFWAFQPEFFDMLTVPEREDLFAYDPQDLSHIPDVFVDWREILHRDPGLAIRARALLAKMLCSVGVRLPESTWAKQRRNHGPFLSYQYHHLSPAMIATQPRRNSHVTETF